MLIAINMAQPVEILLRDEDKQAIIRGLATNQATVEAVANRLLAKQPSLTNRQDNEASSSGRFYKHAFSG